MSEPMPEEWQAIGFSGLFTVEAEWSGTAKELDEYEVKLPAMVPFGTNSGWLAVRVDRTTTPATAIIVRKDSNAVVDICTGRLAK